MVRMVAIPPCVTLVAIFFITVVVFPYRSCPFVLLGSFRDGRFIGRLGGRLGRGHTFNRRWLLALGFKVAASSTGYLFARTLASGIWSDWSRILNVTNDKEDFGVLMFARRSDEPETDSSESETEE